MVVIAIYKLFARGWGCHESNDAALKNSRLSAGDADVITRTFSRRGLYSDGAVHDVRPDLEALQAQPAGGCRSLFHVKTFAVVFDQYQQFTRILVKTDIQPGGAGMFERIVNDLLYDAENVNVLLRIGGNGIHGVHMHFQEIFLPKVAVEFADGVQEAFSFQRGGQQVVRDLPHAGDDLVYVFRGLADHLPVLRVRYFHAADVQLHAGQQGAQAVVQVRGNPFAFVLQLVDLRGDAASLQADKAAVIPDDGSDKKDDDHCQQ